MKFIYIYIHIHTDIHICKYIYMMSKLCLQPLDLQLSTGDRANVARAPLQDLPTKMLTSDGQPTASLGNCDEPWQEPS